MSKQFSRGRRGGGIGGMKGVAPFQQRRGGQVEEKQRPSVFDRLGTRRPNPNPPHYSTGPSGMEGSNRNQKSSERMHLGGSAKARLDSEKPSGRGNTRSQSPTPKHKHKASLSAAGNSRKNLKSAVESKKDRRKHSPSNRHGESSKIKSKTSTSKHRKVVTHSARHEKGKRAHPSQSPSESSEESGEESSTTTSSKSTTSSASDDASSNTTSEGEGSSSSESSAPSIKLKSVKKDKEQLKRKLKRKSQDVGSKEKSKKISSRHEPKIRSRSSSVASVHIKSHTKVNRRVSPSGSKGRSGTREHDFKDRHDTQSPSKGGRHERISDSHTRRGETGRGERNLYSSSRTERIDEASRKRRLAGDNYDSPSKRTKLDTPNPDRPDRFNRKIPSPTPLLGRTSHSHGQPPPKPKIAPLMSTRERISPLNKRPHFEDNRRGEDIRRNEKERYTSPSFSKPKDSERDHEKFSGNYDYSRGEKQRERQAPSREVPQGSRERPHIQQDRRHVNSRDIDRRGSQLPASSDGKTGGYHQRDGGIKISPNESFNRTQSSAPFRKRSPLIMKTKEALMEKYEEIRQSRVDMWVDETVRVDPLSKRSTSTMGRNYPDERSSPRTTDIGRKSSSIGSRNEFVEKGKEIEEDQLSDFSDDADDILTKDPPPSQVNKGNESEIKSSKETTVLLKPADSEKVSTSTPRDPSHVLNSTSGQSQSQSQADDDLLERLEFEEISDEELGEGEPKMGIVDALGVDWSSLVCREKAERVDKEDEYHEEDNLSGRQKLKDKWSAANILKQVGLSRQLAGEELFDKAFNAIQAMEERNGVIEKTTKNELEFPNIKRKRLERKNLLEDIGIGPCSRALSARRDLVVRRYLLNLTPRSLVALDMLHQSPPPRTQLEVDYIRSLKPSTKDQALVT